MQVHRWSVVLSCVLCLSIAPVFSQERKPIEVSGRNVLDQLDVLIIVDKTVGKSEAETLSLVESIILLNKEQIQSVELANSPPDSFVAAFAKDNSGFRDLRASICKQRPHLTRLIDLDGKLKSCEQN